MYSGDCHRRADRRLRARIKTQNGERCDAIDVQSCARIHQDAAAERAEETERRRKRLVAANDLWRANYMLRYQRKLESHLAHAHITGSACVMRRSLWPQACDGSEGGGDTRGGATGRRAAWALGRRETE